MNKDHDNNPEYPADFHESRESGNNWTQNASPWLKKDDESKGKSVSQYIPPPEPQPAPPIQQQQSRAMDYSDEIKKMIHTAGSYKMTEEQKKILYAPIKDYHILIKPEGSIYLPWTWYHERMNRAFGPGAWVRVPDGAPRLLPNNLIVWGFHLIIEKIYFGVAIGEMQYYPKNLRNSYGEACEAAKSNALVRLCKDMGISIELWDKSFARSWEQKYAESYFDNEGKTKWRLKAGVADMFQKMKDRDKNAATASEEPIIQPATQNEKSEVKNTTVSSKKAPAKKAKKQETGQVQMEEIKEHEVADAGTPSESFDNFPAHLQSYYQKISMATSVGQVQKIMSLIKMDLNQNVITEAEKEQLRVFANKRSVVLNNKIK